MSDQAAPVAAEPVPAPPPLPFARLFRSLPTYRWWRPLVAIVVGAIFWIVFQTIFAVAVLALALVAGDLRFPATPTVEGVTAVVTRFLSIDTADAFSLVAGLGGVATLLPAVILACAVVGLRPTSVLRSIAFRIRWGWLALCLLPALLITGLSTLGSILLLPLIGLSSPVLAPTVPLTTWLVCALVIVVLTPVQAAAEEFAFRGLLLQAVGGWVRPVVVAVIASTIVFSLLHSQYQLWATLDVAVFGVVAAILAVRTGGLEASIALHAVNNTVAFLFLASGSAGTTMATDPKHPSSGDPISLGFTVVTMGLYAVIVLAVAKRRRLPTRLMPIVVTPPTSPASPVAVE